MEAQVGVIMGSKSDWETMKQACEILELFEVPYEKKVVSAHRTPDLMFQYAEGAREKGLKVIIAGAGGAAHLTRYGSSKDNVTCDWSPCSIKGSKRSGFTFIDCSNAWRSSSRNGCDWNIWSKKCRSIGSSNTWCL